MPDVVLKNGGYHQGPIYDRDAIKRFGNFLKSIREHRGMTQRDVAYKLGMKQHVSISNWERGVNPPSVPDVFYGLIDIFTMTNDELKKFYDLGDEEMKKALRNDERVQKMLELRKLGMTNKQIATELNCGVSTVYDNIGKRSMDVRKAEEQNKPCPIPEPVVETKTEIPVVVEVKPIEPEKPKEEPVMDIQKPKIGNLTIRSEVRIIELDGIACNYRVNTGTGEIELLTFDGRSSLVEGILDRANLDTMIGELQSIRTLL